MKVVNESDIGEPAFRPLREYRGGDVVSNRAGHVGLVLESDDGVGRLAWFHTGAIWWQANEGDRLFRRVSARVVVDE